MIYRLRARLICASNDLSRDSPSSNQFQWKTPGGISTSCWGTLFKFALYPRVKHREKEIIIRSIHKI